MPKDILNIALIGAGPSNVAFAIAMEESEQFASDTNAMIFESGDKVAWHEGMIFPEAQSQVSFLKDLVTLRNPTSKFSFINYLHVSGRLDSFVNLQTFYPYRKEISAYLSWCANNLTKTQLRLNARVASIAPNKNNDVIENWTITLESGESYIAKRVIYGAGREANVPKEFKALGSDKLVHASTFMKKLQEMKALKPKKIAVIGSAQSAAEVYKECLDNFPAANVDIICRSIGFKPYGGSKFTNRFYDNGFIETFYNLPKTGRERLTKDMHDSNYAGVTPALLEVLYRKQYLSELNNDVRTKVLCYSAIEDISLAENGMCKITCQNMLDNSTLEQSYDLVVLGTGYSNCMPSIIEALTPYTLDCEISVTESYQLKTQTPVDAPLYLLGVNEASHGISDTLLSSVAESAIKVLNDIVSKSTESKNSFLRESNAA